MRWVVAVAVVVAALAACGEDDDPLVASTSTTSTAAEEPPTCEEWMIRPVTADEVEHGCSVPLGAVEGWVQAGMAAIECADGRTLFWGDAGWGYVGEPMRAHEGSELLAPQAERDACPTPPMPPTVPPPPVPD